MFIKNDWLFHAPACATVILLNTILFTVTPILLQNDIVMNIIYLLFTLDLGVIGFILSSIYVSKYVYKPMKYIEDEPEKEEEIKYEEQYDIDEIEDISGNPSETVYISDMTPDGIAFMRYNKYKEGFEYWAEKSIKYDYLETICRKFVKFYRCKNMYIDRKRLLREKKERAEEKRKKEEELKEMEKEDFVKLNENDDDDDVFAKLKTNVDKRYESKSKKDKANETVVDQANKFIYMGKLNEMFPFTTKRTDELSAEKEKKEMSFSMFKRMGF
jgi:hypothetical protein